MLNWRTSVLGHSSTCPKTGLQNEPKRLGKWAKIGTKNWTPYLISRSLELCSNIQTQSVKKTFRHLPNLLNAYKNYSDQLKLILESAQNDPTRTKKASMEEYKEKYKRSIKSMEYYSRYYAKKSSGTWSIPYLDNIIKAFFNIIDKHNPLNFEYADFKCLIEML